MGAVSQQVVKDERRAFTIPASSTLVVDSIATSEFSCLEYLICLSKGVSFFNKTLNLKVYKSDTSVKDQVYSRNSGAVKAKIGSSIVGSVYRLTIVNDETVDIEIRFTKILL